MKPTPNKRILVIGGAGYVGSALVAQLTSRHGTVAVYDNLASSDDSRLPQHVTLYQSDVRDIEKLRSAFDDFRPTHVVLLAALHFIPYCVEHPDEAVAVNVLGLQNVLDVIRQSTMPIELLFSSSAAVYKDSEGALCEASDLDQIDIYGVTKALGERLIQAQCDHYKIVRLFNVYGEHDPHPHVIPRVYNELRSKVAELEVGDTTPERDFVHVDEVASGIIAVMESGKNKNIYNIGTGQTVSVQEVLDELMRHCNHTPQLKKNAPAHRRKTDRRVLKADISKIIAHTDWRPTIHFTKGIETLK